MSIKGELLSHICDMLFDAETHDGYLENGHGDVKFDDRTKTITIVLDDINEQDYEHIKGSN